MTTANASEILAQLTRLENEARQQMQAAASSAELETFRIRYLGQKSELKSVLAGLKSLVAEEKRQIGQLANAVQSRLEAELALCKDRIGQQELKVKLQQEKIDLTLPGRRCNIGSIHPLTQIVEEIIEIFHGMGFMVADGPEIETDYYNFDALNTPADHAARDSQDTFYTDAGDKVLLRSQTSTIQIRVMEAAKPPLRIIAPGRVYRNEEINARKYPLFHQIEGLLIDEHVTFGQLRGTLNEFYKILFGKPVKTRFRPDFFPFTEPSAELDCQCPFCQGKGCRTCGQRGWLELLGCGMVDPNVLRAAGLDPEKWTGFAFGMGVERLAMLKYGINDIRHFYTNDLRFLEQF